MACVFGFLDSWMVWCGVGFGVFVFLVGLRFGVCLCCVNMCEWCALLLDVSKSVCVLGGSVLIYR